MAVIVVRAVPGTSGTAAPLAEPASPSPPPFTLHPPKTRATGARERSTADPNESAQPAAPATPMPGGPHVSARSGSHPPAHADSETRTSPKNASEDASAIGSPDVPPSGLGRLNPSLAHMRTARAPAVGDRIRVHELASADTKTLTADSAELPSRTASPVEEATQAGLRTLAERHSLGAEPSSKPADPRSLPVGAGVPVPAGSVPVVPVPRSTTERQHFGETVVGTLVEHVDAAATDSSRASAAGRAPSVSMDHAGQRSPDRSPASSGSRGGSRPGWTLQDVPPSGGSRAMVDVPSSPARTLPPSPLDGSSRTSISGTPSTLSSSPAASHPFASLGDPQGLASKAPVHAHSAFEASPQAIRPHSPGAETPMAPTIREKPVQGTPAAQDPSLAVSSMRDSGAPETSRGPEDRASAGAETAAHPSSPSLVTGHIGVTDAVSKPLRASESRASDPTTAASPGSARTLEAAHVSLEGSSDRPTAPAQAATGSDRPVKVDAPRGNDPGAMHALSSTGVAAGGPAHALSETASTNAGPTLEAPPVAHAADTPAALHHGTGPTDWHLTQQTNTPDQVTVTLRHQADTTAIQATVTDTHVVVTTPANGHPWQQDLARHTAELQAALDQQGRGQHADVQAETRDEPAPTPAETAAQQYRTGPSAAGAGPRVDIWQG